MATDDNKRIIKNSAMLYLRMLFTMWINLYATRVVLRELGADDLGVYGVVGSVVSMFTILNSGIVKTVQRYITFELGKKEGNVQRMFSSLMNVSFIMSFVTIVVLEIAGLWFMNTYMNIPDASRTAANWVFQFSIITTVIGLLSNPYNALVIAHEKMSAFAYVSIIQVILNFLAAYCLQWFTYNKLFYYGLFMMLSAISIRIIYQIYCRMRFPESVYHFHWDKPQLIEITKFAGWSAVDGGLTALAWNGVTWLINISFGPAVNAVLTISTQAKNAVLSFAQNVQKAIDPQITKTYAANDMMRHRKLVYKGSKFEVYLVLLIIIPFFVRCEQILHLWLGERLPEYIVTFTRIGLLETLILSCFEVVRSSVTATGKIRNFVLYPNILFLFVVPIMYLLNKLYDSPPISMLGLLSLYVVSYSYRLILACKLKVITFFDFVKNTIIPSSLVALSSYICVLVVSGLLPNTFGGLCELLVVSTISIAFCVFLFGIDKNERNKIISIMSNYL